MISQKDDKPLRALRPEKGLPAWLQLMRTAAMAEISEDDVRQIVRNQVAAAKKGDKNAIRFVFNQVLGGAAMKGATFIQNNYGPDDERRPDKPTQARPGSKDKVETMRRRQEAGEPIFNHADGPPEEGT